MIFLPLLTAAAATVLPAQALVDPNPKAMSQSEIRAFNARLAKSDPRYIRCVRSEPIGSLVKTNFSCRTNAQWKKADQVGNQEVRDVMEEVQSKSWNTSN